jgi:hypothetical protein
MRSAFTLDSIDSLNDGVSVGASFKGQFSHSYILIKVNKVTYAIDFHLDSSVDHAPFDQSKVKVHYPPSASKSYCMPIKNTRLLAVMMKRFAEVVVSTNKTKRYDYGTVIDNSVAFKSDGTAEGDQYFTLSCSTFVLAFLRASHLRINLINLLGWPATQGDDSVIRKLAMLSYFKNFPDKKKILDSGIGKRRVSPENIPSSAEYYNNNSKAAMYSDIKDNSKLIKTLLRSS